MAYKLVEIVTAESYPQYLTKDSCSLFNHNPTAPHGRIGRSISQHWLQITAWTCYPHSANGQSRDMIYQTIGRPYMILPTIYSTFVHGPAIMRPFFLSIHSPTILDLLAKQPNLCQTKPFQLQLKRLLATTLSHPCHSSTHPTENHLQPHLMNTYNHFLCWNATC